MKYIAFIVLGLVLLAAIGGVVLWDNMPTAKLTVHAVRPKGLSVSGLPAPGREQFWPIWEVAITNTGRARVHWIVHFNFKDGEHEWAEIAPGPLGTSSGALSAGQSAVFEACVPPYSRTN